MAWTHDAERIVELRDAPDADLLDAVIDFYASAFKHSEVGRRYLASRGISDQGLFDRFRLGLADRSLGKALPHARLKRGAEVRLRLQSLGILRPTGHEHLNGSVVVPLDGLKTQVPDLYGRKVSQKLRGKPDYHLTLRPSATLLFNAEALRTNDSIVLCEGMMDALSFLAVGIENVVSILGPESFTDHHAQTLLDNHIHKVLVAFDGDKQGDVGTERVGSMLKPLGIKVRKLAVPRKKDINDMLKGDPDSLHALLDDPVDLHEPRPTLVALPPPGDFLDDDEPEVVDELVHQGHGDLRFTFADRHWEVRGLTFGATSMRVTVKVEHQGRVHLDALDILRAGQRRSFERGAAIELGLDAPVIKRDLGRILLDLEQLRSDWDGNNDKPTPTTEAERQAALDFLQDPRILDRVAADLDKCGLVGEGTNKILAYLAVSSRLLQKPVAVVIQSSSAAGKSSLMEGVLSFMPDEAVVAITGLTPKALYHFGRDDLRHRVLAISEDEGIGPSAYALKLLSSEGKLTVAATVREGSRLATKTKTVEGPVAVMLTTTAIDLDPELVNRCIVLGVDEGIEQTRAIQQRQRLAQTLEGVLARQAQAKLVRLHQNAQRLLRPLEVVNPYAENMTFTAASTRSRRDHAKYLSLINTIALVHQHQREVKVIEHEGEVTEYIEVRPCDIELADRLLPRTFDDLPPQTRRLLDLMRGMVVSQAEALAVEPSDVRLSRRALTTLTGWSYTSLSRHLHRLVELELVAQHRGNQGSGYVYEVIEPDPPSIEDRASCEFVSPPSPPPHHPGLVNAKTAKKASE